MHEFYTRPLDWNYTSEEPSTGWLSPEGLLYPCSPFQHTELAGELTQHWRRSLPFGERPSVDSSVTLERNGWLHIGRKSASVREFTGGTFYVRGLGKPTYEA